MRTPASHLQRHSVTAGGLPGRGKMACGRIFRQARPVTLATGGYPAQERTAANHQYTLPERA